jgi:hypothetical protein
MTLKNPIFDFRFYPKLDFKNPRSYSATLGLDSIQLFGLGFSMFSPVNPKQFEKQIVSPKLFFLTLFRQFVGLKHILKLPFLT